MSATYFFLPRFRLFLCTFDHGGVKLEQEEEAFEGVRALAPAAIPLVELVEAHHAVGVEVAVGKRLQKKKKKKKK